MRRPARAHPLWLAYILHRISGISLALFLPIHFWVLSLALTDPAQLNSFLKFSELPFVKIAEFGLVFLLAIHLFGGLRLIAMEWLPWSSSQKNLAVGVTGLSFVVASAFFIQAL